MADVDDLEDELGAIAAVDRHRQVYASILRNWIDFKLGDFRVDPTSDQETQFRSLADAAKSNWKNAVSDL